MGSFPKDGKSLPKIAQGWDEERGSSPKRDAVGGEGSELGLLCLTLQGLEIRLCGSQAGQGQEPRLLGLSSSAPSDGLLLVSGPYPPL